MSSDAVLATLEDYAHAYCAKNIDSLMSVFDESDDISVIGTGADELCAGRAQVKDLFLRNFGEAQANRFEWHWTHTSVAGDHAVVAVTLTIHLETNGNKLRVPVRWTVVLRRRSGRWAWLHRHASTAASGQEEGQAYPHGNA
jgi:ketosteroid isomerase-like protein